MKLNVLLIVMDSVRAQNTSLHGHSRTTTPFLEQFADRSEVYTQARSPAIHSISSHVSMFTGYYLHEHRVREHEASIAKGHTIWEELEHEGYETGLFTSNTVVSDASNLREFFSTVETVDTDSNTAFEDGLIPRETDTSGTIEYLNACLRADETVKSLVNGAMDKWGLLYDLKLKPKFDDPLNHDDRPEKQDEYYVERLLDWTAERDQWAACLNLMGTHYPYTPHEEYDHWGGETLRELHRDVMYTPMTTTFHSMTRPWWQLAAFESLYDGCIRQVDALLEALVTTLDARGELDETLVVITSDHGEGFGEQSLVEPDVRLVDHSYGINEQLTHVPLLVSYPGQTDSNRVDDLATLRMFPEMVRALLHGSDERAQFVPDRPVVSSTFRIEEPEESLPEECPNRADYEGPWYAVYERDEEGVVKYSRRQSNGATIRVPNAQTAYRTDDTDGGRVQEVLDASGTAADIQTDSATLTETAENRLKELGYLRE